MSEQYYNFAKGVSKIKKSKKSITWQEASKKAENEVDFWDFPDPF